MPGVEILAVGSELLGPHRLDTNSLWLTGRLNELGFEVVAKTIVGDEKERLVAAFQLAWKSADVVISTGGLGPTEDDLTREAAAEALGRGLQFQESIWHDLQAKFARLGRALPENNRRQALVLEGARWLENPQGTAPGQLLMQDGRILVLLPGPPRELQPMAEAHVLPVLEPLAGGNRLRRRLLKVIGLGESALDERIAHLYRDRRDVSVTTLFTPLDLEVHLSAQGPDPQELERRLEGLAQQMCETLGVHVYAQEDKSLAQVVVEKLLRRGEVLVTAESVTGGLLAQRLTDVAGASQCFLGGFVPYTARAKGEWLGVPADLIARQGVVSAGVALAMADGARSQSGADYALAMTGFAGPSGGTERDPLGTVYAALASSKQTNVQCWRFGGDRELVRSRAAQSALDWLRRTLLNVEK